MFEFRMPILYNKTILPFAPSETIYVMIQGAWDQGGGGVYDMGGQEARNYRLEVN